jgi:hypothetical protein
MASENPNQFQNVSDGLLQDGDEINDATMQKIVGNQRHLYELLTGTTGKAGETRQAWSHGHGDLAGSAEDGLTIRRDVFSHAFLAGSVQYWTFTLSTTFTELFTFRGSVGAFHRMFNELRYAVTAQGVKFRVEMWDWVDSGSATAPGTKGTQYVEETAYQTATSPTWHTIDGDSYTTDGGAGYTQNGVAATKLLYVNVTSKTDTDEACAQHEFKVYAASSSSTPDLHLYNWKATECLRTDEGGSGILT